MKKCLLIAAYIIIAVLIIFFIAEIFNITNNDVIMFMYFIAGLLMPLETIDDICDK